MLLLLLACAGPSDGDDMGPSLPSDCPTSGDGTFDPANGCVGTLCMPAEYADVEALLGPAAACTSAGTTSNCLWPASGIDWTFTDCDGDGEPDPDRSSCDMFGQEVGLSVPYGGTTADGLGLNVKRECWEAVLGPPAYDDVWTWDHTNVVLSLTVNFVEESAGHLYLYWSYYE